MKSDRELLELAARAIGEHLSWMTNGKAAFIGDDIWSPLDDDGDAFRLAVKLHLSVHVWFDKSVVETDDGDFREPHGTDPYAATRRAIVRASAKIGEGK